MTLLEVDGVTARRGGRDVLHQASLTVERGEIVVVLGPNGAGKSTLLEVVGGLLRPRHGSVRLDGRVATVLQQPGLARRSVRRNVELAQSWWGVPRGVRFAQAVAALDAMGAGHLARRPASALSGGERRRVHVARGLALRPDLLLLDEPFAGLDSETRQSLTEDTATALRAAGSGVLLVLHDRAEAWALADRLVVLIDGHQVAAGPPDALLTDPPSPEVARFLGFDGELLVSGSHVLTRATQVRLDPAGPFRGRVTRAVRRQDGVRLEVTAEEGSVQVEHPGPAPAHGELVRFRLLASARFPASPTSPDTIDRLSARARPPGPAS